MCEYEGCQVPSEPGEELCILHLPSPKDIARFKEALYLQVDEKGADDTRNSRFSFKGYQFPCSIRAFPLDKRLTCPEVVLPFTTTSLDFRNASIEGSVFFETATIGGNALFSKARIRGDVKFSEATIEGAVLFDAKTTIKGNVFFNNATIRGSAVFDRATIEGNSVFDDVTITKQLMFTNVTAGGSVDFRGAVIGGNASFNYTTIGGYIVLRNAAIERSADFKHVTLKDASYFSGCSAGSISLGSDAPRLWGWSLDMRRCGIVLSDVVSAASFWKFALLTFSKNGERDEADLAFYFERIWRLKALRRTEARKGVRLRRVRTALLRVAYWILWALDCLLLRWTTAYGASLLRLLRTWFVVIGGFGIAFSLRPSLIQGPSGNGLLIDWIRGLHYSTTTFATLGLGNVGPGPSRLGMVLTSIEALLGALLIALAVLVIGRRFMR